MTNLKHLKLFPIFLVLFEMATYLSSDMYLPALPTVMRDLNINHHLAQLSITVWFLGSISVQLILGPISDRFGRRHVLCFGGIIFVLATVGCALAPNIHLLLIARFFQGMSICFMAVPGYASIHESFEQKEAVKILAFMASVAVLAPALGPVLGSVLLSFTTWRWIFGFLVLWGAVAVALLIAYMPETLPPEKRHAINAHAVFNHYKDCILNPRFMATCFIFGFLFCGFITWITGAPFIIIDQFKQSSYVFSFSQTIIFISYIFANHMVKKLVDHKSLTQLIRFGLNICLLTGIYGLIVTKWLPNSLYGFVFIYVVYAYGTGFCAAPLNRLVAETSDVPMGYRMAVFSTFISGFAALSSVLVSTFYHHALFPIAVIIFVVALLAFGLDRAVHR